MIRLYRWLLFLYPADYRAIFAAEMIKVFDQARAMAWKRGIWQRVVFCVRELTGLVWTASYAHMRIHGGWSDRVKGIYQGQAAVRRLIIILAATVAAIEMLKLIALRGHYTQSTLRNELLLAIVAGLTVVFGGAAGWTVALLFRRAGLYRIANIETKSEQM